MIEVEVDGIVKNLNNDKNEYYYYLSSIADEENINNWVKITEAQDEDSKLKFTIDSKKLANYEAISNENVLYLYVKEVAIKGGNQSIVISKSISLESDATVEVFVDNEKQKDEILGDTNNTDNSNSTNNSIDNTIANGKLPHAGLSVIVITVMFITLIAGVYGYVRYKKLSKYVK